MSKTPDDRIQRRSGRARRPEDSTDACGQFADLIPGYTLGAIEPDEAADVQRHTARCPACRRQLDDLTRSAALLPFLAPLRSPAPDVKVALFARIAQAHQGASGARLAVAPVATPPPTLPASRPVVVPPVPSSRPEGRRWFPPLSLRQRSRPAYILPLATATVPLVLALAVVGGWAMSLSNRANDRTAEVANLQASLTTMSGLLASDGTVYDLTAGPAAPRAVGKIYVNPTSRQAILMVWGLRGSAGAGYTVYMEQNGTLVPVQALTVDQNGNGQSVINLDQPFGDYRGIHIKAQPLVAQSNQDTVADALSTTITPPPSTVFGRDVTVGEPDLGSGRANP